MFGEILGAEDIASIDRHVGDEVESSNDLQSEIVLYEFLKWGMMG